MSKLKKKVIIVGVSGGIACYKVCDLVRRLREQEAYVHVMMTEHAQDFVTPLTFQTLSGNPVHTNLFSLTEESEMSHIALAEKADLVIIAPATADLLAKVAHGLCPDILTTVICATRAPVLLAPSMNTKMWEHSITQDNIKKLKAHGYTIIDPDFGDLACGTIGMGRLPETQVLTNALEKRL